LEIDGKEITISSIMIVSPSLNEIVEENKSTRAWVGRKHDGIYVGFRKEEVRKLEKMALEKFGIKPLEKLEKPPFNLKMEPLNPKRPPLLGRSLEKTKKPK